MLYKALVTLLLSIGLFFVYSHFYGDTMKNINNKWQRRPQNTLNNRKEAITGKKLSRIEKFKADAENALRASNSKLTWEQYQIITVLCVIVGIIIGLLLKNVLLSIIMAGAMAYVPFAFLMIKKHLYSMSLNEQLQEALSTINTAYMNNDDINNAVANNLHRIPQPINTIFSDFVTANTFIDSNISRNITAMREKLNNRFWHEWCDYLILAQTDREMRYVLMPIVEEMSTVKNMQEELKTAMFQIYREFALIAGIVVLSVPGFRLLNHTWYVYLTETMPGKIVVAIAYLVTFLSLVRVIKVNQPMNDL